MKWTPVLENLSDTETENGERMPVFNSKQLVGRAVYKGIKVFAILPKKKKLEVEKLAEKVGIIKTNTASETTNQITEVHVSILYCNYETSMQNVEDQAK